MDDTGPGVMKLTLPMTCLQILFACLIVSAAEPEVSVYSNEVLDDDPICFFLFEKSNTNDAATFRNRSRAKTGGPDCVYSKGMK